MVAYAFSNKHVDLPGSVNFWFQQIEKNVKMISILAIQFVYEMEFNCSTSFRIAGMWAEMMTRTASLYTNTQKVYYPILESLIYSILCTIFVCWTIILLQCIEEQHPSFSFPSYNKVAGIPFLISSLYSLVRDMYEM